MEKVIKLEEVGEQKGEQVNDDKHDAVENMAHMIDSTIQRLGNAIGSLRRLKTEMQAEPDDETRIARLMNANISHVLAPLKHGTDLAKNAESLILGRDDILRKLKDESIKNRIGRPE